MIRKDDFWEKEDLYFSKEVWGVDIFNTFIDFRKWYKIKLEDGSFSDIWFLRYELGELNKTKKEFKRVSFFESSGLQDILIYKLRYCWIILLGFVLGRFL